MSRVKLTAGRIRDLSCPTEESQIFLWDSDVSGLAVRATPSGKKTFFFQGRIAGKSVRVGIGDVRDWGIEEAREEARSFQKQIDIGLDPRKEKSDRLAKIVEERESTERQETTFGDAWKAYLASNQTKWSARHFIDHQKAASETSKPPGPLAEFLRLRLSELTPEKVKDWLGTEVEKRPTYAAIAFRKLRAFLNWASEQPDYTSLVTPDACSRKVSRNKLPKNRAKTDCLQREQLNAWFASVLKLSSPVVSAYLQGLLITGARREELATLRWENVDLKWKSIIIKDKVEGERTIPLTPYFESLLLELKRINQTPPPAERILHGKRIQNDIENWKPSEWVFSSKTSATGRIVEPRIAHNRALAEAGLPDLTLHGLRRSFGTLAEWVECPVGISAQIMGHKPSALAEKHYRQRPIDLLRMWHTKIEAWMLNQAGIKVPSIHIQPQINVIQC